MAGMIETAVYVMMAATTPESQGHYDTLAQCENDIPRVIYVSDGMTGALSCVREGLAPPDTFNSFENRASFESHAVPRKPIDPRQFYWGGVRMTLGACMFEDSRNCYWDARTAGNGTGRSFRNFIDVGGVAYYMTQADMDESNYPLNARETFLKPAKPAKQDFCVAPQIGSHLRQSDHKDCQR